MTMRDTASHMPTVALKGNLATGPASDEWPGWIKALTVLGLTGILWTLIISAVALIVPVMSSWL